MLLKQCCPAETKVAKSAPDETLHGIRVFKMVLRKQLLSKNITFFHSESKAPMTETSQCLAHFSHDMSGPCSVRVCFKRNCRTSSESPGVLFMSSNTTSPSAGFEKQAVVG